MCEFSATGVFALNRKPAVFSCVVNVLSPTVKSFAGYLAAACARAANATGLTPVVLPPVVKIVCNCAAVTVVIPPPDVHGRSDISGLAKDVPAILAERLREAPKLKVKIAEKNIDANEAAAFDAVIITTVTEDAGIIQLNVQVVTPRTRAEIWNNAYQSSHQQFRDMVSVAGDGVRRALD